MVLFVIFAGGLSSRFGRDKCTFVYRERRLIDYVIEVGRQVADRVVIAAGRNANLYPGETVLPDSTRFSGPLAAVDSATHLFDDELLFAPCDMPFLKPKVFKELLTVDTPFSVWVFPNGRVESAVFKASPAELKTILDFLARVRRSRIDDIFRLGHTTFLSTERHGIDPVWLKNINRSADLSETAPVVRHRVYTQDQVVKWRDSPLVRWLINNDVNALKQELLHYIETGLLSMAAHVAKDLAVVSPSYKALAEALYEITDIEKA